MLMLSRAWYEFCLVGGNFSVNIENQPVVFTAYDVQAYFDSVLADEVVVGKLTSAERGSADWCCRAAGVGANRTTGNIASYTQIARQNR